MYLSQWRLNRPKTSAGGYFNPYDLHKILWKTFPGRPEAKRDFLFRVDKIGKDFSVLLLSAVEPAAAEDLIKLRETAQLDLKLETGAVYRFALRANPVKRLSKERDRVPLVGDEELSAWLKRKFAGAAEILESAAGKRMDIDFLKAGRWGKITAVDFDGCLRCEDGEALRSLLTGGIGAAKAFGCGLLLLQRANA